MANHPIGCWVEALAMFGLAAGVPVAVYELHGPHPGQAAQGSGGLFAELPAELGDAQRQLTVAALA